MLWNSVPLVLWQVLEPIDTRSSSTSLSSLSLTSSLSVLTVIMYSRDHWVLLQESEWRYKILNRIDFQNLSFSRWKSLIWWKEYLVTCAVYDQLGICYTLYLYLIFFLNILKCLFKYFNVLHLLLHQILCSYGPHVFPLSNNKGAQS